jgi:hypothetical protein
MACNRDLTILKHFAARWLTASADTCNEGHAASACGISMHIRKSQNMPTYVSIVNWSGCSQPSIEDVRRAIGERDVELRRRGMHSLAFLPDEGVCTGIMVATCGSLDDVDGIAAAILPSADVRVESMMFEDEPGVPAWISREVVPPPPRDFRRALLKAIASDV